MWKKQTSVIQAYCELKKRNCIKKVSLLSIKTSTCYDLSKIVIIEMHVFIVYI